MLNRVQQTWCAMHGHDDMLQFESDRMFLRCATCGHESPGWAVDRMRRIALDSERQRPLVRPLMGARRAA